VRKKIVESLLKELPLDNGLVLEITDESSNYYADFWNLKVVIRGKVQVASDYLQAIIPTNPYEQEAKEALGSEVSYHRELTRIGVREYEKEAVIQKLLSSFKENFLPYLEHTAFPERMVRSHWKKLADEIKGKRHKSDE
jgi:vacuolar-type H+-ATPase subunit C/Vma6